MTTQAQQFKIATLSIRGERKHLVDAVTLKPVCGTKTNQLTANVFIYESKTWRDLTCACCRKFYFKNVLSAK